MIATQSPTTVTTDTEADGAFDALFSSSDFDRFTRDPAGFGDYDWNDQISLEEFTTVTGPRNFVAVVS